MKSGQESWRRRLYKGARRGKPGEQVCSLSGEHGAVITAWCRCVELMQFVQSAQGPSRLPKTHPPTRVLPPPYTLESKCRARKTSPTPHSFSRHHLAPPVRSILLARRTAPLPSLTTEDLILCIESFYSPRQNLRYVPPPFQVGQWLLHALARSHGSSGLHHADQRAQAAAHCPW